VFRLHIFEVHKATGFEKGRQGFQNSGDLLDGELRALFVLIECAAPLLQLIPDALLNCFEFVKVETSAATREKLNRPLIDQFFGCESFFHAQFGH
jgi:hypothetical protein